MTEHKTLGSLDEGEHATVAGLSLNGKMGRRLRDLGLVEGTNVRCLQKSPLGDPVAFLIRGAVIALRSEDSSRVLVEN